MYVPALIGALVLLAATAVLAYGALRLCEVKEVPEPAVLYEEYNEETAAKVLFDLAVTKAEAFEINHGLYDQKARLQQGSLWTPSRPRREPQADRDREESPEQKKRQEEQEMT